MILAFIFYDRNELLEAYLDGDANAPVEFRIPDLTPDNDVLNLEDIAGGNLRWAENAPLIDMGSSTAFKFKKSNAGPNIVNAGPSFKLPEAYERIGISFSAEPAK